VGDYAQPGALFRLMNAGQKEQLFSNLADAMQGVPERVIARQLVHFYEADPEYGLSLARKPGLKMEICAAWAKLSLAELIEKTA
jgi:catalase